MLNVQEGADTADQDNEETSVAKIFEEIKVMFQDLPSRIERRMDPRNSKFDMRFRHMQLRMIDEISEMGAREVGGALKIVMIASQFRDEVPWLYDVAVETYRKVESGAEDRAQAVRRLVHIFELTMHHPLWREMRFRSKERGYHFEESLDFAMHSLMEVSSDLESEFAAQTKSNAPKQAAESVNPPKRARRIAPKTNSGRLETQSPESVFGQISN
jgi:hypothetical protein